MTVYDDALTISTILITVIIVPWVLIVLPAFMEPPIGNSTTLNLLEAQGFHWIAAVAGAMTLLVLLIGAWLD